MSLESCPSCKKQVSIDAESCPKCGHPLDEEWRCQIERKKKITVLLDGHREEVQRNDRKAAKTLWKWIFIIVAVFFGIKYGARLVDETPGLFGVNKPEELAQAQQTDNQQTVSNAALPRMKVPDSVKNCIHRETFRDWESQCERIFSYTVVPTVLDGEHPALLTLAYDGNRVGVIGMVPEWYHQKFYTNKMPTLAVIGGKTYVANRGWFNEHRPPLVTVGSSTVQEFQWKGNAHWVATEKASEILIRLFRKGIEAKVKFLAYDNQTATISLRGFSAALDAATVSGIPSNATSQWPNSPPLAIAEVAKHLTSNNFKVTGSSLRAFKNPKGLGYYVYVPQTQFSNTTYKRMFIWFVGNDTVMKLNGAAHKLTPNLPWPREVDYRVLDGANMVSKDILDVGLSKAFGG